MIYTNLHQYMVEAPYWIFVSANQNLRAIKFQHGVTNGNEWIYSYWLDRACKEIDSRCPLHAMAAMLDAFNTTITNVLKSFMKWFLSTKHLEGALDSPQRFKKNIHISSIWMVFSLSTLYTRFPQEPHISGTHSLFNVFLMVIIPL